MIQQNRESQQGFTKDLHKIRPFLAFYLLKLTQDLPTFYQRFILNIPKIYPVYQTLTKHLPKAYQIFTNDLPKIWHLPSKTYQRFTQKLPKIYGKFLLELSIKNLYACTLKGSTNNQHKLPYD